MDILQNHQEYKNWDKDIDFDVKKQYLIKITKKDEKQTRQRHKQDPTRTSGKENSEPNDPDRNGDILLQEKQHQLPTRITGSILIILL